nr:MAG TPA_asm: hypothetical protein [Caudoviricetes sp.]
MGRGFGSRNPEKKYPYPLPDVPRNFNTLFHGKGNIGISLFVCVKQIISI